MWYTIIHIHTHTHTYYRKLWTRCWTILCGTCRQTTSSIDRGLWINISLEHRTLNTGASYWRIAESRLRLNNWMIILRLADTQAAIKRSLDACHRINTHTSRYSKLGILKGSMDFFGSTGRMHFKDSSGSGQNKFVILDPSCFAGTVYNCT